MKYGILWDDIWANTIEWLQKGPLNEGFDDNGRFATYNINEVYQKLERTVNYYIDYIDRGQWKFEAAVK